MCSIPRTILRRAWRRPVVWLIALALLMPVPLRAQDKYVPCERLPGISCTPTLVWTAVLVGGVAGGLLAYMKLRHHRAKSEVRLPARVEFTPGTDNAVVIENTGAQPVSVSEVTLRGRGFELSPMRLPLVVAAAGRAAIPMRMVDARAKARLVVTYFEQGKERTETVLLRPGSVDSTK